MLITVALVGGHPNGAAYFYVLFVSDRHLQTVLALARALDIRDAGTAAHSDSVARHAAAIAELVGLAPRRVQKVRLAGALHDIGKIGVSDHILRKPGPLADDDWAGMKTHPTLGAEILRTAGLPEIARWVEAHHERLDGSGYPFHLPEAQIPLEASRGTSSTRPLVQALLAALGNTPPDP